jgi:hypothetical protein
MASIQTLRRWSKQMDQYYKNVSTERLIADSKKAGIILEPMKTRRASRKKF